jgi:flavodoxin
MPTVSVIYFSGSGHTTKLAEAVNKGAASVPGVKTNLNPPTQKTHESTTTHL